jgi:hypothetical protein
MLGSLTWLIACAGCVAACVSSSGAGTCCTDCCLQSRFCPEAVPLATGPGGVLKAGVAQPLGSGCSCRSRCYITTAAAYISITTLARSCVVICLGSPAPAPSPALRYYTSHVHHLRLHQNSSTVFSGREQSITHRVWKLAVSIRLIRANVA